MRLTHPTFAAAGLVVEAECAADDPRVAKVAQVIEAVHSRYPFVGVVTLGEGIAGVLVTITAPRAKAIA